MRTRVKICGITREQDARFAVASGVDAIGLVFYPQSPRYVGIEQAHKIARAIEPFVSLVGLFVNAAPADIRAVTAAVPLALLQFHGQEKNADCTGFGLPFIKSIPMRSETDLLSEVAQFPDASGFLLDTYQPDTHGGGGKSFDWQQVPAMHDVPLILAGGLAAENVALAIRTVRPYAVDVSSGVESASGIKSADRIQAFMTGVQQSGTETGS
ncbi:MAG: phosphoribosylanthranilate isomerase [Gammaproteobacteria bacterium]